MDDNELFILSLFYMNYSIDNNKKLVKTNYNIEQILNNYAKFELVDSKNTINLY